MNSKFQQMYVLEWLHKPSGEWTAVSGSPRLKTAQREMRAFRKSNPEDNFRIRKYVPQDTIR